jgi:hypothetical protein
MSSHEDYAAFLASIKRRPDGRVIGVIEPAADSCSNPPASSAPAGPDYTITPITPLHRHQGDDTEILRRDLSGLPPEIANGLAALGEMAPPAGFSAERWTTTVNGMRRFARQYAMEAISLGWTAADLFGLNSCAPAARYDGRGVATMLSEDERVVLISSDAIVIERPSGARLTFRRSNGAASPPAWQLR